LKICGSRSRSAGACAACRSIIYWIGIHKIDSFNQPAIAGQIRNANIAIRI
jgi:hypothetical protein